LTLIQRFSLPARAGPSLFPEPTNPVYFWGMTLSSPQARCWNDSAHGYHPCRYHARHKLMVILMWHRKSPFAEAVMKPTPERVGQGSGHALTRSLRLRRRPPAAWTASGPNSCSLGLFFRTARCDSDEFLLLVFEIKGWMNSRGSAGNESNVVFLLLQIRSTSSNTCIVSMLIFTHTDSNLACFGFVVKGMNFPIGLTS